MKFESQIWLGTAISIISVVAGVLTVGSYPLAGFTIGVGGGVGGLLAIHAAGRYGFPGGDSA